ncbi:hypothetical protein ACRE_071780 [Hapsidospora chrysogenum ATCC 11550]|uniref:Asteroid domain-containing protein n=1 Tax=Hapsidospora chrysogenum (strain ATCC 11550 / CBS 779.69 / DSM 880 / IAM 14645 / JCM 23072 / IMI 49137) TaxID=857340 RepID=A0A086SY98_HAPC1|nr:hypothetical protein ACRE_071780 [Hapsidospora chrysogenum ATCC 11550]
MGIPRLISTLEPFAVRGPLEGDDLVIDGPALAYHVLYICRRNRIGQPSYDLLGRTTVSWLDKLSSHSSIKAIYFDGHLPPAKLPVRMERMVKSTSQLNQFYSSCTGGRPGRHLSQGEETDIDLFTSQQPENKQLLPPSFLVPAIIDALRQTDKYGSLVHQVPGEADAFCARHVATYGGIVLTSDSDLLVHDLAEGKVIFFRDIHLIGGKSGLECLFYDPRAICRKLGIPIEDALRLGYEVSRAHHASISQITRDCKQPLADEEEYKEFCREYLHHETSPVPTTEDGTLLHLECLDPRLSELALQLGNSNLDGQDARIFLPVLIENPLLGSAWEQSTPVRQLAYTMYRWAVPGQTSSVQEYRRVNMHQQKGRAVGMLPKDDAYAAIEDLLHLMKRVRMLGKDTPLSFWLTLSLVLDIRECQDREKKSRSLRMVGQSRTVPGWSSESNVSWDLIHLTAQLQAAYYSFRILQQILSLCSETTWESISPQVWDLHKELVELPPLTEFPDTQRTVEFLGRAQEFGIMKVLGEFVNVELEPETSSRKRSKTKKRKNGDEQAEVGSKRVAKQAIHTGRNMFSLLSDE